MSATDVFSTQLRSPRRSRSASPAPNDNAALAALYAERGHSCTPADMSTRLSRVITDPAHAVIVAETVEKKVVGAIHVSLYRILEWDEAAQILGVIVSPAHQRRRLLR